MVQEGDEGVDVGSASSAARDNLVLNNGDWVVQIVEGGVWLNNEREGKLALLEQAVGCRHGVQRRSNILGRTVGIWGRSDAGIGRQNDGRRREIQLGNVEGLVQQICRI